MPAEAILEITEIKDYKMLEMKAQKVYINLV